jgi:phage shock protein C
MTCPACNNELNTNARFCSACGRPAFDQPVHPVQTRMFRPRNGRAIGGVCAAFAQHFGWDVILVRLAFVAVALFGCGSPVLAYLIAWIVIPNEPYYFNAPPTQSTTAPPTVPMGSQPTA